MKNIKLMKFLILILLLSLFGIGCGGKKFKGPKLHPCNIMVKKSGVPLDGAVVTFAQQDKSNQYNIVGWTDVNGMALMRVEAEYDGVPEGNYIVCVKKTAKEIHTKTPEEREKMSMGESMKYYAEIDADRKKRSNEVPVGLHDAKNSRVNIQVKPGKNILEIDVDDYK